MSTETISAGIVLQPLSVKDLPKEERPREKIMNEGTASMEDYELLAVLLRTGIKGKPVLEFAKEILSKYSSLEYFFDASFQDFIDIKGLGLAKAAELTAMISLAKKWRDEKIKNENYRLARESIRNSAQVEKYLRSEISDYYKEHFYVISLDIRNRVIDIDETSTGILTSSLVHPRETFEIPIRKHAASIMVAHNHPSGDVEPSTEDIGITKRLSDAGNILGIKLLDHFILSETKFYSFKEKGLL